jgi:acyl-CoA thioesterase-2
MAGVDEAVESPLEVLLECLDLTALDADLFLGDPGPGEGRLFGGMVAAQSVIAAGRTVPAERNLHSLHAYFLRPGRHDTPLRFVVDRIRDGRSFTTRRVKAHQAGEAIFNMSASFAVPEEGISHQDPMPEAPPPDSLEDLDLQRRRVFPEVRWPNRERPVEIRSCDPVTREPSPPAQRSWFKMRGKLPEAPLVQAAMLVYCSDQILLSTASRPHAISPAERIAASLDHAVWIHRPVRLEGWLLYASQSPAAHAARGLVFGAIYSPDGQRVASVAQEGLVRRRSR